MVFTEDVRLRYSRSANNGRRRSPTVIANRARDMIVTRYGMLLRAVAAAKRAALARIAVTKHATLFSSPPAPALQPRALFLYES